MTAPTARELFALHPTPEAAAAAVRRGRSGYIITVRTPAGLWTAYEDFLPSTRTDARTSARCAMETLRDATAVVVVDEQGKRLHVPAPQHLARPRPRKGGPRP